MPNVELELELDLNVNVRERLSSELSLILQIVSKSIPDRFRFISKSYSSCVYSYRTCLDRSTTTCMIAVLFTNLVSFKVQAHILYSSTSKLTDSDSSDIFGHG